MRPLALLVLLLAGLCTDASARVLRVPQEFSTIQLAVDNAQPGDRVLIDSGTYLERVAVDGKTRLTVVGRPNVVIGAPPFPLEGGGEEYTPAGFDIVDGNRVTLKRLTIVAGNPLDAIRIQGGDRVTVTRCEILGGEDTGIRADGTTRVKLVKNTIENTSGEGIVVGSVIDTDTEDGIVRSNRIENCGDEGIRVGGIDQLVTRNIVMNCKEGIVLTGDAHDVVANHVIGTLEDGLLLEDGLSHVIKLNRFDQVGWDAVDIEADACIVLRNTITQPGDDGLSIDDTSGSLFKGNRITGALGDGVRLASEGNTLIKNSAKDSADLDLRSLVGADGNTFTNNTFPNNNIDL